MSTELVGLAILMGLVTYPWRAANVAIAVDAGGARSLQAGIEWLSVGACMAIVAWRRNLFAGLLVAVALAAVVRAG